MERAYMPPAEPPPLEHDAWGAPHPKAAVAGPRPERPDSTPLPTIVSLNGDDGPCPLRDLPDWLASRATWVKTGHLGHVQAPERNAQMRKPIF